ncbi:MAG: DUF1947 domain-containing protein [Thermococci archaeon]|nr:DUF1947 domain-containing protein [Thermococci archaeon]
MELKSRHPVGRREVKAILNSLIEMFGEDVASNFLRKKDRVEVAKFDRITDVIFVNGKPTFIKRKDLIFPLVAALYDISERENLKLWKRRVVVDEGAVPHILNGADVMAPGVVDADEGIREGDLVFVIEQKYGRPLAIGIALEDGRKMVEMSKGKVVKVIHHAKDKLWDVTVGRL